MGYPFVLLLLVDGYFFFCWIVEHSCLNCYLLFTFFIIYLFKYLNIDWKNNLLLIFLSIILDTIISFKLMENLDKINWYFFHLVMKLNFKFTNLFTFFFWLIQNLQWKISNSGVKRLFCIVSSRLFVMIHE